MKKKTKICLALAGAILLGCSFYNGLVYRDYEVETKQLSKGKTVTALLISDLHSKMYGEDNQKLLDKIALKNPDIILCSGDMVDDVQPIIGAELFFKGAVNIAPTYYVTGNHENRTGNPNGIKKMLSSLGVVVLSDEYLRVNINGSSLIIGGINDPENHYYEEENDVVTKALKAFDDLKTQDGYKILLTHRPELYKLYGAYPFDLVVSGHSHGGQARIPFLLNGIIAPNQGFFPKRAGGLYKDGAMTHIVSRGTGIDKRIPRIFNPPEIVTIKIVGTKE